MRFCVQVCTRAKSDANFQIITNLFVIFQTVMYLNVVAGSESEPDPLKYR